MATTTRTRAPRLGVQELTALMIQSGGAPGMRAGGSSSSGMCAVGQIGGTQTSFRAAVLQPQNAMVTPRLRLYVGSGAELR